MHSEHNIPTANMFIFIYKVWRSITLFTPLVRIPAISNICVCVLLAKSYNYSQLKLIFNSLFIKSNTRQNAMLINHDIIIMTSFSITLFLFL